MKPVYNNPVGVEPIVRNFDGISSNVKKQLSALLGNENFANDAKQLRQQLRDAEDRLIANLAAQQKVPNNAANFDSCLQQLQLHRKVLESIASVLGSGKPDSFTNQSDNRIVTTSAGIFDGLFLRSRPIVYLDSDGREKYRNDGALKDITQPNPALAPVRFSLTTTGNFLFDKPYQLVHCFLGGDGVACGRANTWSPELFDGRPNDLVFRTMPDAFELPAQRYISNLHCTIGYDNGTIQIRDHSKHGTGVIINNQTNLLQRRSYNVNRDSEGTVTLEIGRDGIGVNEDPERVLSFHLNIRKHTISEEKQALISGILTKVSAALQVQEGQIDFSQEIAMPGAQLKRLNGIGQLKHETFSIGKRVLLFGSDTKSCDIIDGRRAETDTESAAIALFDDGIYLIALQEGAVSINKSNLPLGSAIRITAKDQIRFVNGLEYTVSPYEQINPERQQSRLETGI